VLAANQIVLYELAHEGTDLESMFLSLTGPGRRRSRRWPGATADPGAAEAARPPRATPHPAAAAGARPAGRYAVIRVIRAELLKLRTTPGPWVVVGVDGAAHRARITPPSS